MTLPILTPKQKLILDFITEFRGKHGYAPSQHEIAKHFGYSSLGTVQNYLVRLERQGALTKTWNARRSTQVVPPPQPLASSAIDMMSYAPGSNFYKEHRAVSLPLVGRVAAGRPIEAIAAQETVDVPTAMIKGKADFVLKVVGDSMIEDGILDGDYVVIKKQPRAENGQTVVALINNEATIKRYQRKSSRIELHPANPKYKPIIVEANTPDAETFKIEGVLMGVIRLCR